VEEVYENLFDSERQIHLHNKDISTLAYYPNRNSLPYIDLYELDTTDTFIRTTLRYPSFMKGWSFIVNHHLTNEAKIYLSDNKSLRDFFNDFINEEKVQQDSNLLKQFNFLGMNDYQTLINKGTCSPADVLQMALERKLVLSPQDKDMIVMQHEFCYDLSGRTHKMTSELIVMGDDAVHTAMAKTVGLPLGIAAKMILNETINLKGLHIPIKPQIYEPVLQELQLQGIQFREYAD
jgi:saccharopine dehydrogenase (NADP+, L-glutamate forming)